MPVRLLYNLEQLALCVSEVHRIVRTTADKHCVDWKLSTLIGDKIHLYIFLLLVYFEEVYTGTHGSKSSKLDKSMWCNAHGRNETMHYSVNPRLQLISKSEMLLKISISFKTGIM